MKPRPLVFGAPSASRDRRLESRLDRRDSDVTVITQCSLSRLSRLERMCSLWTGVLSVAIIAERGGSVGRRMRRLTSALHKKVELGGKCRLDMYLCEPSSGPAARDGLYPMNALRNIALDQARTDLVLLLVRPTMGADSYRSIFAVTRGFPSLHGIRSCSQTSDTYDILGI